jgi:type IV fimbrial biogenesis protein FimT
MRGRSHGLTLLEVVVALAIIGVLLSVGVLAYAQMVDDLRLNHAARQVMLDLTITRTRALADNTGRRLVFLPDHDSYQPQVQISGHYGDDGVAITLPAGIDLTGCTASGSAVAFRPRGNAATFGTITLRNRPGHERRIVVDIAGRIRVDS